MRLSEPECGMANPACPDSFCELPRDHVASIDQEWAMDIWHGNDSDGWFTPRCGAVSDKEPDSPCVLPKDHVEAEPGSMPFSERWHGNKDGLNWR